MVALRLRRLLLYGIVVGALTLPATPSGAPAIVPSPPDSAVKTLLYADGRLGSGALLRFGHGSSFCRWYPGHRLCVQLVALLRFCDRRPDHRLCGRADEDRFCKLRPDHPLCGNDGFCGRHPDHRLCARADDGRFCKLRPDHPLCGDDRFCSKRPDHPRCGDKPPSPS